jgi:hypothetical protein
VLPTGDTPLVLQLFWELAKLLGSLSQFPPLLGKVG